MEGEYEYSYQIHTLLLCESENNICFIPTPYMKSNSFNDYEYEDTI